jgi:hypothetical protein
VTSPSRKSTQLSRRLFSQMTTDRTYHRLSQPHALYSELYGMMLLEDSGRAFPYEHHDDRFTVSLTMVEGSPGWENQLACALDDELRHQRNGGRTYRGDLEGALRKFSEFCIHQVLMFGEAAYEIVFSNPDDQGRWREFHLVLVHPYQRRLGRHRHYKAAINEERGEWITLPDQRVVVFRIEPPAYRRDIADAVNSIRAGSGSSGAYAGMVGKVPSYDFGKHMETEQILLARATKALGWTGRGLFVKEGLQPYVTMRSLQFALFQAHLRDMVHRGVQEALDKAGQVLDIRAELQISGVPSVADIMAATQELETGPGRDRSLFEIESACHV